jgi:hypothetical protein
LAADKLRGDHHNQHHEKNEGDHRSPVKTILVKYLLVFAPGR